MLSKINIDIINSLTISELDVLRFVDNNKKQILDWSIQTLSKTTFVSTATIMRLCKKLGYSGFSELKYRLKEEISALDSFKKTPLSRTLSIKTSNRSSIRPPCWMKSKYRKSSD
ncbi:MAG TPA: hypothetical protein DD618_04830 [Acholeplasmatales bacterium]|nr:hypothetical protein [Acholeplasmatales bacterium]